MKKKVLFFTEKLPGNGDVAALTDAIAHYIENHPGEDLEIKVLILSKTQTPQNRKIFSDLSHLLKTKFGDNLSIASTSSLIDSKDPKTGAPSSFRTALSLLFTRRGPANLEENVDILVVPSAHRLARTQGDGNPMKIDDLRNFFTVLSKFIAIESSDVVHLSTELCRLDTTRELHDHKQVTEIKPDTMPRKKGLYRYASEKAPGIADEYLFILEDKRPVTPELKFRHVKFTFQSPYLRRIAGEKVEAVLPVMPSTKIAQFQARAQEVALYSAKSARENREVLDIVSYIPTDSPTDPLNFNYENLKETFSKTTILETLKAHGITQVHITRFDLPAGSQENMVKTLIKKSPGIVVEEFRYKRLPQAEFIQKTTGCDLFISSGDFSYLESLLNGFRQVGLYCARYHKRELEAFANGVLFETFPKLQEFLPMIAPGQRQNPQATISGLYHVIKFAAQFKIFRSSDIRGLQPKVQSELKKLVETCKSFQHKTEETFKAVQQSAGIAIDSPDLTVEIPEESRSAPGPVKAPKPSDASRREDQSSSRGSDEGVASAASPEDASSGRASDDSAIGSDEGIASAVPISYSAALKPIQTLAPAFNPEASAFVPTKDTQPKKKSLQFFEFIPGRKQHPLPQIQATSRPVSASAVRRHPEGSLSQPYRSPREAQGTSLFDGHGAYGGHAYPAPWMVPDAQFADTGFDLKSRQENSYEDWNKQ